MSGLVGCIAVVLTVVHTHRTESCQAIIYIISARRATKQEEYDYAESL